MFCFCGESLCLWAHLGVFWLHGNIKRHHFFLRIAWRALIPVQTKYPKHSSLTKGQTQNCGPTEPSSPVWDSFRVFPFACQVLFLYCMHLPLISFCFRLFNCSTCWEYLLFTYQTPEPLWCCLFDLFINR